MRFRHLPARVGVALTLILLLATLTPVPAGASGDEAPAEAKVVYGKPDSDQDHPWLAAVLRSNTASNRLAQFCGGALVAPLWVATAAHCVSASAPSGIDVLVGATDLEDTTQPRIRARRIIVHPDYEADTLRNDMALIELTEASPQPTIEMVGQGDQALWTPGTIATLRGWGRLEDGTKPSTLYRIDIPRLADPDCAEQLDGRSDIVFDATTMLCAGEESGTERPDACSGDSGSPLVVPDPDRAAGAVTIGLVSWGPDCGLDPSGYTRLAVYQQWADSVMTAPPPGTGSSFSDIGDSIHAPNISRIATRGIATGFADGTYRPREPVQRGQMASFLDRAIAFAGKSGVSGYDAKSGDEKVWYGDDTAAGAYPFMAAVTGRFASADSAFCGGTLIDSHHVVTAAHCVDGFDAGAFSVFVGATDLSDPGPRYLVDRVVAHHGHNDQFREDIALLRLSTAPPQAPAGLVRAGQESLWMPGAVVRVLGWGRDEHGSYPLLLQQADLTRLDDPTCAATVDSEQVTYDSAVHLCAGGSGPEARSACDGDSGGPLLVDDSGTWRLVGIVSFGPFPDCNTAPGTFTRVPTYAPWIDEVAAGYFSDSATTVHRAAIHAVVDAGVATGFPDGTFQPDQDVTRGQMASFLARALQLPPGGPSGMSDIGGSVHRSAIEAVVAAGIASGFGDGTFRPDDPVSRGQMATFLVNAGLA